jgi:hypothetical protein
VSALLAAAAFERDAAVVCATHDPLLIDCAAVELPLDGSSAAVPLQP